MRFVRLDLIRYGKFNDFSLDFGSAPSDGSDFHIVRGLNEAGKSTISNAMLDLLFGIEKQSGYGAAEGKATVPNWHAHNTMRIGARLELGGVEHEMARIKRDKFSLLGADDRPFDEMLIRAERVVHDRAAFRMMFSLNEESLEKGGEAILASHGDLGELLFSASAGLSAFSAQLEALREKANQFHKRGARKSELAEKKQKLDALKEEREKADTLAATYAELIRRRDAAAGVYETTTKILGANSARIETIQAQLSALPHLYALRAAMAELHALGDLPILQQGARENLATIRDISTRLSAHKETAESIVKGLVVDLGDISVDALALEVAGRVEHWRDMRSRFDTATDISNLQAKLSSKRSTITEIVRSLGRGEQEDARKLLLSVQTIGVLEDLIAERSGVLSKLETEREAVEAARAAHSQALAEMPPDEAYDGTRIDVLKVQLAAARRDDSMRRLRAARAELDKQKRKLEAALASLAPWHGDPAALAKVSVPGEAEIEGLRLRLSKIQAESQQYLDQYIAKSSEGERLKAEARAASNTSGLIDDQAAADIRSTRDSAWVRHRATLDIASADVFEAAMRRDDHTGRARLAGARELATLRQRSINLAGVEADCARAKTNMEESENALDALGHEIAALMPAAPPVGRDALSFLDAWRARRSESLALAEALREVEDNCRQAEEDGKRARTELCEALAAAGIVRDLNDGLDTLIACAENAIGLATERESSRRAAKKLRDEVTRLEGRLKGAVDDDARWRQAWRKACARSWLGESEPEPALEAVRRSLKALEDLRVALNDCDDLDYRVTAMERDKRIFAAEVARTAADLATAVDSDVAAQADAIESRVAKAHEVWRRREEKTKALEEARLRLAEIDRDFDANSKFALAMLDAVAASSLAEVAVKIDACERRDALKREIEETTHAIRETNVADSFELACAILEAADPVALKREMSELKTRAPNDNKANAEAYGAWKEAANRLEAVGGDDAVARIEEKRRTILEEIREGALRYLSLHAGIAAADAALGLYRDRHRGAMMECASQAFSLISRGAYRGLTAQPNGVAETLIALVSHGGSKEAQQLSKGARFQLYLALRIAGYLELAKVRRPAPFFADDIMDSFDPLRAEEALRLLGEMGRVGQIIYFTHHPHFAQIAQRICPEAKVHEVK